MCSSTLSVNCEKAEEATQRYPDCRSPYFAAVAGLWSAPDYPRERGDSQEGGNRRCLPSCAPARRQRRFPRFASAPLPMSASSRLTNTRKKGILILLAGMAELADAPDLGSGVLDVQVQVLLPAPTKKRCGISPQRFSFAYFYLDSLLCAFCSKRSFATIAR